VVTAAELLADIRAALVKTTNALEKCVTERDAALADLSQARAQLDQVRRDCDTMIAVHDEVEAERDRLRAEVERLEALFQQHHGVHHGWVAEVGKLREENARLREALGSGELMVVTVKEWDALNAKLGRAVAALRDVLSMRCGCRLEQHDMGCPLRAAADISADVDSTAAADTWRAQQEERAAMKQLCDEALTLRPFVTRGGPLEEAIDRYCATIAMINLPPLIDTRRGVQGEKK